MKTKNIFFILTGLIFLACSNLYGQKYYMYVGEEKRIYQVSSNKILIQSRYERATDSVSIRNTFQAMSVNAMKFKIYAENFMLVHTQNMSREQVVNFSEQLNLLREDIYATPVLSGVDGVEFSFVNATTGALDDSFDLNDENPPHGTACAGIISAIANNGRGIAGQGNLLRQAATKGGAVQFNVSNLPDGIYYLHVYDGVSEKPEMQQIVIEH